MDGWMDGKKAGDTPCQVTGPIPNNTQRQGLGAGGGRRGCSLASVFDPNYPPDRSLGNGVAGPCGPSDPSRGKSQNSYFFTLSPGEFGDGPSTQPKALQLNLGSQIRVAAPRLWHCGPPQRGPGATQESCAQRAVERSGTGLRTVPAAPARAVAHLAPPGGRGPAARRSAPTRPAAALPAPGPRPCRPQPLSGCCALSPQPSYAPPPGACASSTRPSSQAPMASPLLSRRGGRGRPFLGTPRRSFLSPAHLGKCVSR